jgi:hypothetical protein
MKLSRSHLLYVQSKYIADLFAILIAFGLAFTFFNAELINVSHTDFFISLFITSTGWFVAGVFSKLYVDRRTKKFSEEIIVSFYNVAITILVSSSCFFYLFSTKSISNNLAESVVFKNATISWSNHPNSIVLTKLACFILIMNSYKIYYQLNFKFKY